MGTTGEDVEEAASVSSSNGAANGNGVAAPPPAPTPPVFTIPAQVRSNYNDQCDSTVFAVDRNIRTCEDSRKTVKVKAKLAVNSVMGMRRSCF